MMMAFSDFVQKAGWLLIPVFLIGTPLVALPVYKTAARQAGDGPSPAR